jgi:virginiamycin B lyase
VRRLLLVLLLAFVAGCGGDDDAAPPSATSATTAASTRVATFPVPAGSHPHDVWARDDGTVWYTAQVAGKLGVLDPATGKVREIDLGAGSRPHGVIGGPDGAAWITDGGTNAIVRVDPKTDAVKRWPLPPDRADANLNTATFAPDGTLWFTGNNGIYGRLRPGASAVEVFDAPGGPGPYGITATADAVYYSSLSGSHLAQVDPSSGAARVLHPPTADQGSRRAWADSRGRVWTSQWNAGQAAVFDPATDTWKEWKLPGSSPQAYAVYVDGDDVVWLTDFGANAIVSFDADTERFTSFPLPDRPGEVRQLHGRDGEVWGAESAADKLVVVRQG